MREIGAVLFDGFEMLDLYGPLEMFSALRDDFRIVPVAEDLTPKQSSGGPATMPEVTFSDRADFDILLVPGGRGVRAGIKSPELLDWLARAGAAAEVTSSVCTGSLLLAKAGLLDGRRATTNKIAFQWVADQAPSVTWEPVARWVVDGPFYTSSGVSAGIDMSLALIAELVGAEKAAEAAYFAEYTPNPDPDTDPFAKDAR